MIDFQKYLQHMVSQWYKIYAILHRVGNVVWINFMGLNIEL
jgi:hypothetical protein